MTLVGSGKRPHFIHDGKDTGEHQDAFAAVHAGRIDNRLFETGSFALRFGGY
jgi:hypothetical protein